MKVAIVTGGTKGIGKGIAKMLLSEGYKVYINYSMDNAGATMAAEEFSCISNNYEIIRAPQNDSNLFKRFIEHIKCSESNIDCIICNAGSTNRKSVWDLTDQDWTDVFQVSLNSHFYLIRDLHPIIRNNARIIFIGSLMGIYPHSVSLPYGVSKAAVHALAKNLVKEFVGTGITVNAIVPGFVETEWQKNKPMEIRNNICQKTASGRFATIEEIVSGVRFCIENSFLNGAILEISGGYCFK